MQEVTGSTPVFSTKPRSRKVSGLFLFITSMFYTYIIFSERIDRYYIGSTDDLQRRLSDHNSGRTPSTRHKGPWVLKWSKEFPTCSEALAEEKRLKSRKSRVNLEQLISGD